MILMQRSEMTSELPPPFVVFALPRSRTFWISRFLSYGGWTCGHEELRHLRGLDDIRSWLSLPLTGTVETAAAPFWRLLRQWRPDARVATIRRPVMESHGSLMRMGIAFDAPRLLWALRRLDAKLDQIERRCPDVLRVDYGELRTQEACQQLFLHCLSQTVQPDPSWWQALAPVNLQCDLAAMLRYMAAHRPQLDKVAKQAGHRIIAGMKPLEDVFDGVVFQEESFASFNDAIPLFREHLVLTDQAPDDYLKKNLPLFRQMDAIGALHVQTARSNGRLFGYLVSIVFPSLDSPDVLQAEHTIFFASPAIKRLGMRLQRAAVESLKAKGVTKVLMRTRQDNARLATIYRRLGAEPFGEMYRLEVE